ncbi:MAG: hypothetical protein WDO06_01760 [Actinomycetota bacterium]
MEEMEDPVVTPSLKYAQVERERRFLLRNCPAKSDVDRELRIHDKYLHGTRMRLRQVIEEGQPVVFKLGQKVRAIETSPSEIAHTTIYLSSGEFELFAKLPGNELYKVRSIVHFENLTIAFDVFEGLLSGLVLAEIDLGDYGVLPSGFVIGDSIEVTEDERFTGGALAKISAEQLRHILREMLD